MSTRPILDSSSKSSFRITELWNKLGINNVKHPASISSINSSVTQLLSLIVANTWNYAESYLRSVNLLIISEINWKIPTQQIIINELHNPSDQ